MDKRIMQIPKDRIDEIFKRNGESANPHQATVLVELYLMAIPDWYEITKVKNGWPIVTEETNKYLFRKWIEFDSEHHPKVQNGGLWLNNGFSTNAEPVPIELSPLPHFHAYTGHLDYGYLSDDLVDDLVEDSKEDSNE